MLDNLIDIHLNGDIDLKRIIKTYHKKLYFKRIVGEEIKLTYKM